MHTTYSKSRYSTVHVLTTRESILKQNLEKEPQIQIKMPKLYYGNRLYQKREELLGIVSVVTERIEKCTQHEKEILEDCHL